MVCMIVNRTGAVPVTAPSAPWSSKPYVSRLTVLPSRVLLWRVVSRTMACLTSAAWALASALLTVPSASRSSAARTADAFAPS